LTLGSEHLLLGSNDTVEEVCTLLSATLLLPVLCLCCWRRF